MRILCLTEAFWPSVGGVEVFLARFVSTLRDHGHEVEVIAERGSLDPPDDDLYEGVPVHWCSWFRALESADPHALLLEKQRASSIVRRFRPDVIHVHLQGPGALVVLGSAGTTCRLVVSVHNGPVGLRDAGPDTLLGRVLDEASWVTAVSRDALARLVDVAPGVGDKSSVIAYGLVLPRQPPSPLSFERPRLLCAGRLVPMKGFDVAIDALEQLASVVPGVRLTITGDGPERATLARRAAERGVGEMVEFTGWASRCDLFKLIDASTVVLIPSRGNVADYVEGFPLVALEAAGMARPVVASRAGGLPEAVLEGITGLLVEPGDASVLASAVLTLVRDPTAARSMGQAGRRRVLDEFSWASCVRAYEDVFHRAVAPCGRDGTGG